jgi:hypothetical protein
VFIQERLEGRSDATYTVTFKDDDDVFTDDNVSGSTEDEKAAFLAGFDLLISTNVNAAKGIGQYLDADPDDGINVAIPIVTSQYRGYGDGTVGSGLLDFGSDGAATTGATLEILDGGHPLAGRVAEGIATVYSEGGWPTRTVVDISPDADVIATATTDGQPSIAVFEVGDNLYDALPGGPLDDPIGDDIPARIAMARMITQWWSNSINQPAVTLDALELFDAAVDYALDRTVHGPWLGDATLDAATKLTIAGTGGEVDLRSITATSGTATVVGAINVFRGLAPGVDVAGRIDVDGSLNVEGTTTYTWDTLDDVIGTNGALTLGDGWTLLLEEDGVAPVAGTAETLFEYGALTATLDGVFLSEVNIDATAVPTWGATSDMFVRNNAGASAVELYIAPTLDWDFGAVPAGGDYEDANWLINAVPGQSIKELAHVTVGGGSPTVTTARTGVDSALSLAVTGGSLTVGATGTLDVVRDADVDGVGTALNVDGTLNVAQDLNIASGGLGGAVAVSATGVASVTNDVNVGAAGSLTVTGGQLDATTLNTVGTTSLTNATGTIGTLNATGGGLSLAGTTGIGTLNVDGATVTPTAGAGVSDLQMTSGLVDLAGGTLTVATATLNGGVMDASANDLVVSGRVKVGIKLDAEVTAGDPVAVSGADLSAERTMTLADGSTVLVHTSAFPETGLVGMWEFDETTGTTAADSSINGNTGTLANFVAADSKWVAGKVGGALDFDGADDQVNIVGYKGVTGTQSRTTAAWIKTTDGAGAILSWGTDAGGQKWILRTQTDNGQQGAIRTEVNGGFSVGATDLRDDAWHHVVMVLIDDGSPDVNEMLIYVDGQLETPSATQTRAINTASSADVRIGNGHANRRFDGLLDQVAIWDRALAADEIAAIYGGGVGASMGASGVVNQPNTHVVFSGTSTLALDTTSPARLGNVSIAAGHTATIDSPTTDITLTNLTLGSGSMVKSTATAQTADVAVTVSGKLSSGGGNSNLGDSGGDWFFTNLALADTATLDWMFTSNTGSDVDGSGTMVAIDDSVNVFGSVDMAAGLTIQLVDGLPPGVNAAGVDVALFWAITGTTIDGVAPDEFGQWTPADLAKVEIRSPAGAPVEWTWDGLEYVNEEYVVLKGLVTGIQPGDANGDNIVDFADVIVFNEQFGMRGAGQTADWNNDLIVDLDDLQILKDNFGFGVGGGAPELPGSETPEPATMSLLALGGLLILRRRRRKA